MLKPDYTRQILALDSAQLELFVRDWVDGKNVIYHEVTRFSGTGDRGRDVVGFFSSQRHEGNWDNYQCKQYSSKLTTDKAICELGKILYYSHLGEFTAPHKYYFVAPHGINRKLSDLVYNPSKLKQLILNEWDNYCKDKIIENTSIILDAKLRAFIESYEFSKVSVVKVEDIITDAQAKAVLFKWFGADPGPAPKGQVPLDIQAGEQNYIAQLLKAYEERAGVKFTSQSELLNYIHHKKHFDIQRERFFHADAFKRFYRDNTSPDTLDGFENDIYFGIVDVHSKQFADTIEKIDAVMVQAAKIQAAGPLATYAHVPVKQGICHHFANENKLTWTA